MKKLFLLLAAIAALAVASISEAALVPGVFDPGATHCPVATYANGVLHVEKNCVSSTDASAGADITGLAGQTFTSAKFTLASAAQCQGGSPRFNIYTAAVTFFLGCNNVTPTANGDGTVTYLFDAATIADGGAQVPVPTGTITGAEVLIDQQGTADISSIFVNGVEQVPAPTTTSPTSKAQCKKGGWKTFTNPAFRNQGQCVAYVNHHREKKHGGATADAAANATTTSQAPAADDEKGHKSGPGANAKGKNKSK